MGRTGKSEWDAAMSASGHRVVEKKKKWTSRLRSTTKNTNIVDNITREQVLVVRILESKILNERLEALERENYDEEETVNESELYDEKEDVGNEQEIDVLGLKNPKQEEEGLGKGTILVDMDLSLELLEMYYLC